MPEIPKTTPVYRIENPNILSDPDGITSHEELVGQWFSSSLDTAITYLRKSTQTFGPNAAPVEGARLVVAHVSVDQLASMHVSRHPVAATMDVESDNYIVPRDGSVEADLLPLDEVVGDLRGRLGNFNNLQEAKQRIYALLGEVAVG